MYLPKISVKRPVTTIMMMLLIIILGFVSLTGLKIDLMPNMNPPVIAIMTTYPGAGPEEVTEMVSKPIEDTVSTSQGLKTLESRSSSGSSLIIAQYEWGANISEIREDLNTKLSQLQFGEGINRPIIVKFDPTMMPVIQFNVTSTEGIENTLNLIETEIQPQLQNISGVAQVTISGGYQEEINVALNAGKLKQYNLTQEKVVQLIQGNNLALPGGTVEEPGEKLNLRMIGKINSIEQLKNLPVSISKEDLSIVMLQDVADIKKVEKNRSSLVRTNKMESIMVSIQKEGTANTAEVTSQIRNTLQELEEDYDNLTFTVATDQGEIIEQSISNVSSALLYGGAFAVIVILLFLRSISTTFIVGISIPFSVITAFVLMYFSGISLNIMSLGGLALGVGMLVDNAIVVIENIYRHFSADKGRKAAAIEGTIEVAGAVTASMLTTIAVFLPVVFVGGLVGDLFKELALSVTYSLLASWAVSMTVVPTLAALLIRKIKVKKERENTFYKNTLGWVLTHRFLTTLIAALLFIGALFLIPKIGTEFMPSQDEGMFTIDVNLPEGATTERTLSVVNQIEDAALAMNDVSVITAEIGTNDPFQSAIIGAGENKATITIKLEDNENRSKSTLTNMENLKDHLSDLKDDATLTFNVTNSLESIGGHSNTVEILVLGNEKEQVKEYTNELENRISKVAGITDIASSTESGKPEYQFQIDSEAAFKNGLTTFQIASFTNKYIQGETATKISTDGVETDVQVFMKTEAHSKNEIENIKIPTPLGTEVTLDQVGDIVKGTGPVTIVRENQNEAMFLNVSFEGVDMGTISGQIQSEIDEMITDMEINTDLYSIKMAGGTEMMNESFSKLQLAMILAIIFVYMIMASQFESLIHPLIIMLTLPLSLIGVISGLLLSGYSFGITAFIGIIILVGIVVNNAIVFIDYTNQLRKKGMKTKEALIKAGATRIRPILMTALTTMLGLLPLAIGAGEGTEIQAPMAIAVIGGLFSSTILTLIVIPVVYSLVESMKGFRQKWSLAIEKFREAEEEFEQKPRWNE